MSLVMSVPSSTLTVIVVVPFAFGAGVIVTVRLAPLPPKTMLPFGTSVVLLEVPLTMSEPGAVSTSPTVKPIAPVFVSSSIEVSGMSDIVGVSLTGFTVIET